MEAGDVVGKTYSEQSKSTIYILKNYFIFDIFLKNIFQFNFLFFNSIIQKIKYFNLLVRIS